MNNEKVTIRDVAAKAGVSISSVHFALSGKNGVSEATREKIRQAAEEVGYKPNVLASSLKRTRQKIVILLPCDAGENQYFYKLLWQGIHDYLLKDNFNFEYIELPFELEDECKNKAFFQMMDYIKNNEINGILTVGFMDDNYTVSGWEYVKKHKIPVVCVGSGNRLIQSVCTVQPEYDVIGRMMAQLICDRIPPYGGILLCAGNPKWATHTGIVKGFKDYMQENGYANRVYSKYFWTINDENYVGLFNELSMPDIAACCSVFSQGSVMLGQALEESQKAPRVLAVGSDLADATVDRLRKSVFDFVIQKNPYAQGYVGMRTLIDYLIRGTKSDRQTVYVGSDVVMKSNLIMYESEQYRYLFI